MRPSPFGFQLPSWIGITPALGCLLARVRHLKLPLLDMHGETGPVNSKHALFTILMGIYLHLLLSPINTQPIKMFGKESEKEIKMIFLLIFFISVFCLHFLKSTLLL